MVRANVRLMYWSPSDDYPYYDGPRQKHPSSEDRLRHVVFLDGRLIDTWTEPVEATAYHSWAQELERSAQPRIYAPEPACPAPHEVVLDWLDGVVGGRAALLALDDRPLELGEAPEDASEVYAEVVALLERVCRNLFDDEFRFASCAALTSLWRSEPAVLNGTPAEVAGGVCWMVGRANGCVGAGTAVTQQVLKRELWLKAGLTPRATRFKERLRDLLPTPSRRPSSCPNLLEVGSPTLLTGATRRELISLRDRALAAAAVVAADQRARQPVLPGSTAPLA